MAIQPQNLKDLISGVLRIMEPTDERSSNKTIIWRAECVCGHSELGTRTDFEKYAGLSECPGHPFKGKEKPVDGFRLHPDNREEPGYSAALAAWEQRRHPDQSKGECESSSEIMFVDTSVSNTDCPCEMPDTGDANATAPEDLSDGSGNGGESSVSVGENRMLRERLKLPGYTMMSVSLLTPVALDACIAEKVVFAKQLAGTDLVFLHLIVSGSDNKPRILSSKKKIPPAAWQLITDDLSSQHVVWRDRTSQPIDTDKSGAV